MSVAFYHGGHVVLGMLKKPEEAPHPVPCRKRVVEVARYKKKGGKLFRDFKNSGFKVVAFVSRSFPSPARCLHEIMYPCGEHQRRLVSWRSIPELDYLQSNKATKHPMH